jgi:hypothetical protein
MRYIWLLSLLLLSGCYYPYPYYGYGSYPYSSPAYPYSSPAYPYSSPAYPYGHSPAYIGAPPYPYAEQGTPIQPQQPEFGTGYGGPLTPNPYNCGTPDQPQPCTR